MDRCNHDRCGRPPDVHVYDDRGNLAEILCRPHAVAAARARAVRYAYRDASTGEPFILISVEVNVEP